MHTNYRYIRLDERPCPECGEPVDAVCKDETRREKYWFACTSPRDVCTWGKRTGTHWSDGRRVTREEAERTFDRRYGSSRRARN